jgi:hypothetical protein
MLLTTRPAMDPRFDLAIPVRRTIPGSPACKNGSIERGDEPISPPPPGALATRTKRKQRTVTKITVLCYCIRKKLSTRIVKYLLYLSRDAA